MEQTLRQLGELLLAAVPTVILLLLLYGLFNAVVYKPLMRVLAERRSKTEGAIEKARSDISIAEAKSFEYEAKLREAKLAIFRAQDARRQQALQLRAAAVVQARERAEAQIRQAKAEIQQEIATAKQSLQAEVERLAAEIIRTILQPAGASEAGAR